MKHIFIITIISLIVISCSKEEIRLNHLQGKWNECYDNSEFCMDGRIEYDFLGENAYVQTSYDILSHKMSVSKGYYALGMFGENVLTLNPQMSDFSGESYTIVKLTSKEMVWQKVGTTYSKGTFGTEHRRFKRIK